MTLPAFLFFSLLGLLYGALFHLWRGGNAGLLLLYLLLAWSGFWIGHAAGAMLDWTFWRVGPVNLGMATLTSLIFLLLGHWLSSEKKPVTR
ncbi:MAG: hypothetical protein D6755_00400 [Anaerolineae bacterium]|nr:MAG: hypothetical protein D6755_00400 [Anaerolineae bacterium]